MSAPTPAAVIGAMARSLTDVETVRPIHGADYESSASIDRRTLADHIRAIAAEMRAEADQALRVAAFVANETKEVAATLRNCANDLRRFADKLEGKQ